jgi:putative aldouronate transport system substrate-binding protein
MKRTIKTLLTAVMILSLLITAGCGGNAPAANDPGSTSSAPGTTGSNSAPVEEQPDPFSKMPEMVEFTTGIALPADGGHLPEGEDYENNDIAKWFAENVNVKAKMIWSTSDQNYAYEQKINLLIAANDIPDVLQILVEPHGINILSKLVKNDMIQDLTDVYDKYASPTIKDFMEKAGNEPLKAVTFDGKLMAIPGIADTETAIPVIWTRQDWLDECGLSQPKTLDDVANIIRTFKQKYNAPPLPACQNLYKDDSNTFDFVFNVFKAYPGDWIRNSEGKIVYGSVQPEAKQALALLREWYAEGLIDREFPLKDKDKAFEPIKNNKGGIFMGAWWTHWWPLQDSFTNDPTVDWSATVLVSDDGIAYPRSYPIIRTLVVVKKGFKYPEAIMKCINHFEECSLRNYEWYNALRFGDGKYNNATHPLAPIEYGVSKYADEISRRYRAVMDVVDGRTPIDSVDSSTRSIAESILEFKQLSDPLADYGKFANANQWLIGADAFTKVQIKQKFPAFFGTTDLLQQKRATLEDLEKITFLKIITGEAELDEFDRFVEQWNNLGGKEITEEINSLGI